MYLDLIMKLKKINNREHIFDVVRKNMLKIHLKNGCVKTQLIF